jgi:hypothetical protein
MSNNKPIRRVAIIGTGVIGASWTALFLAKGLDVIATDIAPDAETSLRRFVKAAWRRSSEFAPGVTIKSHVYADPCRLVERGFRQEKLPERIDFKKGCIGNDELLAADVIIASSSSGHHERIQSACDLPRALSHRPSVQSPHLVPWSRSLAARRPRKRPLSAPRNSTQAWGNRPSICTGSAGRGQSSAGGLGAGGLPCRRRRRQRCGRRRVVLGLARWGIMGNMMLNHSAAPRRHQHSSNSSPAHDAAWWRCSGSSVDSRCRSSSTALRRGSRSMPSWRRSATVCGVDRAARRLKRLRCLERLPCWLQGAPSSSPLASW